MNRLRLEFVTDGFLRAMRREYLRLNPSADPAPIRGLDEYPPEQRGALMNAIEHVVGLASPTGDQDFANYVTRRQQATQ